jgi:transposase
LRAAEQRRGNKVVDNIISNLKLVDDGELARSGNILKHWREQALNYFDNRRINDFSEGCHTKIKREEVMDKIGWSSKAVH